MVARWRAGMSETMCNSTCSQMLPQRGTRLTSSSSWLRSSTSKLFVHFSATNQTTKAKTSVCVCVWVSVKVTPQGPHDVVPLTSTVLSSLLASLELLFLLLLAERLLPCHLVSFFLCLCARVKCVFLPSSSFFLLLLSSFLFFFSFFSFFFCNCSLSFLGH